MNRHFDRRPVPARRQRGATLVIVLILLLVMTLLGLASLRGTIGKLDSAIPFHADRTRVKPGITGWAQVNYPYGASVEDARQKLAYDLYYVKHRNLFFDLTILLETAEIVLWGRGAR